MKRSIWLLAALAVVLVSSRYACIYLDAQYDTYRRPWAYSNDPTKPLLVGRWQGVCVDPDNRSHQVSLEIFPPVTDEERQKRFMHRRIKRDRSSHTFFNGVAILETEGRRDTCELWGGLDKPDGHQIHFQFRPLNDVHPPGFNLNLLEGAWTDDRLDLSVAFVWFRPDGSSFSDSADPRFEQKGRLQMQRVRQ